MGVETVIIGEITWGTVYSAVAVAAISSGISYASTKIFGEDYKTSDYDASLDVNRTGATNPIQVVYGRVKLGGTIVYRNVSGSGNKYLHTVLAICEGAIESIENIYLDDDPLSDYSGYAWANKHLGANAQTVDTDLQDYFPEKWDDTHRLQGTAYIYVRLLFNRDKFSAVPTITADIKGKTVYDPRTEETAWSDNPALCIRDYLTAGRYTKEIPESAIDDDSFIAAANYCEEQIDFADSGGNIYQDNRYRCNGVINPDDGYLDNLKALLTSCRGMITYVAGKYKLTIDKPETPEFDFDENIILSPINVSLGTTSTIYNRIKCTYYDQDLDWEQTYYTHDASQYRSEQDNGMVLESSLDLQFTSEAVRVEKIAQMEVNKSRNSIICTFNATLAALQVEVGTVVTVTHSRYGWDAKKFRVLRIGLKSEDTVYVELNEYDGSAYELKDYVPSEEPDTLLINPVRIAPTGLVMASGTDHLFVQGDGTVVSRIYAVWINPVSPYFDVAQVEYRLSGAVNWHRLETSGNGIYISPVADGRDYDVRVRAAYSVDTVSDWIMVSNYTVIGKTAPPDSVNSFSAVSLADGTRQFSWDENTIDPDLAGYRIRYSTNLSALWDAMTPLHSGTITDMPYETTLPPASGEYRFAIKSIDTSGNLSTAVYMSTELDESPVGSVIKSIYPSDNGWPGTITGGYVTGNNILAASDTKTWADFATDGVTWADWTTWARAGNTLVYQSVEIDLLADVIFTPRTSLHVDGSATVSVRIKKEDDESWGDWSAISGDVTARWLQFKITITGTYPKLIYAIFMADGETIDEDLADINTAALTGDFRIAAGDIRLPIKKSYSSISTIFVTLQNVGSGWNWELIDKDVVTGPEIKIYNASGTLADAVIDARIRGY